MKRTSQCSAPEVSQEALALRRRVWEPLSDLFLDTEIDVPFIVRRLRETGVHVADIQRIMEQEVAPVLGTNLFSVTGVWSGFDLTPVEERYVAGKARPTLNGQLSLWIHRGPWNTVLEALLAAPRE